MGEAWERGCYIDSSHMIVCLIFPGSTSAYATMIWGPKERWNETSLMRMTKELTHTILSLDKSNTSLISAAPQAFPPSKLQHTVKVRSGDKASLNLH